MQTSAYFQKGSLKIRESKGLNPTLVIAEKPDTAFQRARVTQIVERNRGMYCTNLKLS